MTHPIKIIHITASSMIGGGPEHVWQLVQHLPDNVNSFIAAPNEPPYNERFKKCVGEANFLPIPQRRFTLHAFWQLICFIRKNKIEIIHSHGKGAGIYGRLAALCTKAFSVHTFHGIHLPKNRIFKWLYIRLERLLCAISRVCIAVSDGEAKDAHKHGFARSKLSIIYNGVFIPKELPHKELSRPFKILHVSRFDKKQKNSMFIYDIALALQEKKLLEHVKFVLVGDGDELQKLEQKISNANLTSYFEIKGQQDSVRPFYQEVHCLISTSRWEGLPLAVLEAQAFGVPAIVSDVVGIREAIENNLTGKLFNLEKADEAADCIKTMLSSNDNWYKMCKNAHVRAQEKFSVATMAERTMNLYKLTVKTDI